MNVFRVHFFFGERGSALIAVYWAVAILSLAVFTTSQFLLFEVEATSAEREQFRAEQLAERAIALASNPAVGRRDPILRKKVSETERYRASIRSEGARLNVNQYLNRDDRAVIENLFFVWGIAPVDAAVVVDAMIDWVDGDDEVTGRGGAESEFYVQLGFVDRPFNQPFRDLDELGLVNGMELVMAVRPDWKRSFSLWASKLDVNEASSDLIQAVCGCTAETARQFVRLRNGPDERPDTRDDVRFESLDEVMDLLDISSANRDVIEGRLTLKEEITRITGVGTVGRLSVEREVVVRNREERPVLLEFSSRRLR